MKLEVAYVSLCFGEKAEILSQKLSLGTIRFKDCFCTSRKTGIEGGGWAYQTHAMHMVPALAGCRMALVVTSHFVSTKRCRNHSSPLAGGPFLVL